MKKLVSLLMSSILLCSCSSAALSPDSDNARVPYVADYSDVDLSYSVTVSDDKRSVSLDVMRENGTERCTVSSPEELASVTLVTGEEGVRVCLDDDGEDVMLSPEAAAGLLAVLGVMSHSPSEAEFTHDGCFCYDAEGWEVCLTLDQSGLPKEARLKKSGVERNVKFAVNGASLSQNRG